MPAQILFDFSAEQWLERTLDDSANRRLALPEAFLATDGCLDIMLNVTAGLVVYEATIRANLLAELPFMATERLLMAAVQAGADRQAAHETIRRHAQEAGEKVKRDGAANDLLERLRRENIFKSVDFDAIIDPSAFIGRAPQQVDQFLRDIVDPIRKRHSSYSVANAALRV